jgi:hypothetical protein
MDPFSIGIAAAGLGSQLAGGLLGGGESKPVFNYQAAEGELSRLRQQLADRKEWVDFQDQERARARGLAETERGRQRAFTDEVNASLGTQINRYSDVPGQLGTTAKRLSDYFAANSGGMPTGIMPTAGGQTAAYETGKLAEAGAFNTQQNDATAKVRSFGDVWSDIGRESLGDKTKMTNVMDYKQGSRALLPAEMRPIVNRQAPQVTAGNFGQMYSESQPDNTFGDIAKGVGGIALSAGLSGWNPFGGGVGAGGGWSTGSDGYGTRGMPRYGGRR